MKSIFLTKKTQASKAFEVRDTEIPTPKSGEVLIKVKAFGLNYADVMARLDLYPDMPPMPCVLGYDVLGEIDAVGAGVEKFKKGDFVVALTRFGGYAEYAIADARVVVVVPREIPSYQGLAMATQLSTAYHAAIGCVNLFPSDTVLIHAAAGGVGQGLVQLAIWKGCTVVAVAGSDQKCTMLKNLGVQHTINYKSTPFEKGVEALGLKRKIDVIFDSVGGSNVKEGLKCLNSDGKLVLFGSAKLGESKNKLKVLLEVLGFGFYSPIKFLMSSRSLIGLNMLAIADRKPEVIERSMKGVVELYHQGVFKNIMGENYSISQLAEAHEKLEKGQTIGKIAIEWN